MARANRRELQSGKHAPSPSPRLRHPGRQGRTAKPAAPPAHPDLKTFLEEVGRMAADALLARVRNDREAKDFTGVSMGNPRGTHRTGRTPKAKAEGPQDAVQFDGDSLGIQTARRMIRLDREGRS